MRCGAHTGHSARHRLAAKFWCVLREVGKEIDDISCKSETTLAESQCRLFIDCVDANLAPSASQHHFPKHVQTRIGLRILCIRHDDGHRLAI
jgi:hypothetical protein